MDVPYVDCWQPCVGAQRSKPEPGREVPSSGSIPLVPSTDKA